MPIRDTSVTSISGVALSSFTDDQWEFIAACRRKCLDLGVRELGPRQTLEVARSLGYALTCGDYVVEKGASVEDVVRRLSAAPAGTWLAAREAAGGDYPLLARLKDAGVIEWSPGYPRNSCRLTDLGRRFAASFC